MARVKAVRGQFDLEKIDVAWKFVVHQAEQFLRIDLLREVDVGHLMQRVNPGVRSTGAVNLDHPLTGRAVNRLHDLARHGSGIGLKLPAAVAGSHVLEVNTVTKAVPWSGGPNRLRTFGVTRPVCPLLVHTRARHVLRAFRFVEVVGHVSPGVYV